MPMLLKKLLLRSGIGKSASLALERNGITLKDKIVKTFFIRNILIFYMRVTNISQM